MPDDLSLREWWPLHIAQTWAIRPTLIRHPKIAKAKSTVEISQRVTWAWCMAVGAADRERHRYGHPDLDFDRTWCVLRRLAADGKVRLRGRPQLRSGHGDETREPQPGPATEIPAAEAEHLMLWTDHADRDVLAPPSASEGLPASAGRWWHDVTVARADVMRYVVPMRSSRPRLAPALWRDVEVEAQAVAECLAPATPPASRKVSSAPKPRRDRPGQRRDADARRKPGPKGYGERMWNDLRKLYVAQIDKIGWPQTGCEDPKWRRPTDAVNFVIEAASSWITKRSRSDGAPARATVQEHIRRWDDELAGNAGNSADC